MRALGGSGQRWSPRVHAQVRFALHEGHERRTLGRGPNLEVPRDPDRAPRSELVAGEVSPRRGRGRGVARPAPAFSHLLDGRGTRSEHVSGGNSLLTRSRGSVIRWRRWTGVVIPASADAQRRQDGDDAKLHPHIIYDGGVSWWVPRSTLIGAGMSGCRTTKTRTPPLATHPNLRTAPGWPGLGRCHAREARYYTWRCSIAADQRTHARNMPSTGNRFSSGNRESRRRSLRVSRTTTSETNAETREGDLPAGYVMPKVIWDAAKGVGSWLEKPLLTWLPSRSGWVRQRTSAAANRRSEHRRDPDRPRDAPRGLLSSYGQRAVQRLGVRRVRRAAAGCVEVLPGVWHSGADGD
jgi:hypothetical protein